MGKDTENIESPHQRLPTPEELQVLGAEMQAAEAEQMARREAEALAVRGGHYQPAPTPEEREVITAEIEAARVAQTRNPMAFTPPSENEKTAILADIARDEALKNAPRAPTTPLSTYAGITTLDSLEPADHDLPAYKPVSSPPQSEVGSDMDVDNPYQPVPAREEMQAAQGGHYQPAPARGNEYDLITLPNEADARQYDDAPQPDAIMQSSAGISDDRGEQQPLLATDAKGVEQKEPEKKGFFSRHAGRIQMAVVGILIVAAVVTAVVLTGGLAAIPAVAGISGAVIGAAAIGASLAGAGVAGEAVFGIVISEVKQAKAKNQGQATTSPGAHVNAPQYMNEYGAAPVFGEGKGAPNPESPYGNFSGVGGDDVKFNNAKAAVNYEQLPADIVYSELPGESTDPAKSGSNVDAIMAERASGGKSGGRG